MQTLNHLIDHPISAPFLTTPLPPFLPQITLYQRWLREQRGLSFDSYDALWKWSVTELDAFWQSIWDYFELQSSTPYTAVCDRSPGSRMVDVQWFTGASVNYAQQVFMHVAAADAAGLPAIISHNEKTLGKQAAKEMTWPDRKSVV